MAPKSDYKVKLFQYLKFHHILYPSDVDFVSVVQLEGAFETRQRVFACLCPIGVVCQLKETLPFHSCIVLITPLSNNHVWIIGGPVAGLSGRQIEFIS